MRGANKRLNINDSAVLYIWEITWYNHRITSTQIICLLLIPRLMTMTNANRISTNSHFLSHIYSRHKNNSQNEDALSYYTVCGLYFLAVVFVRYIGISYFFLLIICLRFGYTVTCLSINYVLSECLFPPRLTIIKSQFYISLISFAFSILLFEEATSFPVQSHCCTSLSRESSALFVVIYFSISYF